MMDLKEEIRKIEKIQIGFDILLIETKIEKISILVKFLEDNIESIGTKISEEDVISVLQQVYGVSYEIGNTKQVLESKKEVELASRILPIARLIFKKSKDLLPYLYLNFNYLNGNTEEQNLLKQEILEIEGLSN